MNLAIFNFTIKQYVAYPVQYILGIAVPILLLIISRFLNIMNDDIFLGWILMVLMWSAFIDSLQILENKEIGVEVRVLASPISWLNYLSQSLLAGIVIMALRICIFLTIGVVLNGWSFIFFVRLFINYSLFSTSIICLGFFFSRIFSNIRSATMAFSFISLFFVMLGGVWIPLEWLPTWLYILGMLSPVHFAVSALQMNDLYFLNLLAILGFVIIFLLLGSIKRKVFN